MPFEILRNDITRLDTEAIVNAANTQLQAGGGVCGAIFAVAGHQQLQQACDAIGHCPVGGAVITPGFDLAAKYVIHAVGPIWQGGRQQEEQQLRSCYTSALELAYQHRCKSVAFPLISAGIYGYPPQQALNVAVQAIRDFLQTHEMRVVLVLFDRTVLGLAEEQLGKIRSYLDDNYAAAMPYSRRGNEPAVWAAQLADQACMPVQAAPCKGKRSLEEVLEQVSESFSGMLLRLIDEKGLTDVAVYKRANLDRKLFSKLRKSGYNPSKATALALAVALELNLDQTRDLLAKAGYALSPCSKFDLIVQYFIETENYDIYEINRHCLPSSSICWEHEI